MKKLSREEAAKVLEGMKVKAEIPKAAVTQWERNAALDMAIEVLNCSEIPNKSDTISRRAAIDTIMGQPPEPHYPSWYAAQIEKLPAAQPEQVCVANVTLTDEQVKEAVEKAKNAVISVIEPEPHWTPCSERLPETYGAYLVQDVCGTIFVDYWRGYWLAKTTMVAWMPLPEPYRGGEKE